MRSGFQAWGVLVCGAVIACTGCGRPGDRVERKGDEIVAAGQLFHTGTPVVLWTDPGGYDAYRCRRHFESDQIMPKAPVSKDDPNRYGVRKKLSPELEQAVAKDGWTLPNLQQAVDQFVIHYDVCGTSQQCFKILHDVRGLSVQFMLDIDGTLYQTLDLKERAWHAGTANDRSIGVEIAHIGAYPDMRTLNEWYSLDAFAWPCITLPAWMGDGGIRTPGFVGRPARPEVVRGRINGHDLVQYDFTPEQYTAMIRLCAALTRVFPRMKLDVPRDADGRVRADVMTEEELNAWSGLLGHWHITRGKIDPGPAFDWDRVLNGARGELSRVF